MDGGRGVIVSIALTGFSSGWKLRLRNLLHFWTNLLHFWTNLLHFWTNLRYLQTVTMQCVLRTLRTFSRRVNPKTTPSIQPVSSAFSANPISVRYASAKKIDGKLIAEDVTNEVASEVSHIFKNQEQSRQHCLTYGYGTNGK